MGQSEWKCVNDELPEKYGVYDVTIEDSYMDVQLMNVAIYRVQSEEWELMIERDSYEGWRIIAWRDRGEEFKWENYNKGK